MTIRIALVALAAALSTACSSAPVRADTLTVTYRGTAAIPTTATDQNGQTFSVGELSGITWMGGSTYWAVSDAGGRLVELDVTFEANGTIDTVTLVRGVTLADALDFEGIAPGLTAGTVLLSDEEGPPGGPGIRSYRLSDGGFVGALAVPGVFSNTRSNRGFESLTRSGNVLWTANEEALTVDGPASSPSNGTVVRLLRYDIAGASATPSLQLAYRVEPMHGTALQGQGQSGLSELVALPDGRLLALERSLALGVPAFLSRVYLVDPATGQDISGFDGLDGEDYTAVEKQLLWSGAVGGALGQNLEGLTLGPALPGGGWVLLGVVDDGDGISGNNLVAFELVGVIPEPTSLSLVAGLLWLAWRR
jgi:hypothetical protein